MLKYHNKYISCSFIQNLIQLLDLKRFDDLFNGSSIYLVTRDAKSIATKGVKIGAHNGKTAHLFHIIPLASISSLQISCPLIANETNPITGQ